MMKSIVFAALVAAVYADADASGIYGGYGLGAYGVRSIAAVPTIGYSTLGYGSSLGYGRIWKRSADAEADAEADASVLYGGYGYAAAPAYGYSAAIAPAYTTTTIAAPALGLRSAYGYGLNSVYGLGLRSSLGYGRIWKRSADADADAEADASILYGGYGYAAAPA